MDNDVRRLRETIPCWSVIQRDLGEPLRQSKQDDKVWPCPFHSEQTTGGFHVFKDGYHCFSCGANGDIFDWLKYKHFMSIPEAIKYIEGDRHDELIQEAQVAEQNLQAAIDKAKEVKDKLKQERAWLEYHRKLQDNDNYREYWRSRGVEDWYQNWYQLGFCEDYTLYKKQDNHWIDWHHTPSLSIPIWDWQWSEGPNNIKHRLLNPPNGTDQRYIQERRGIPAAPFITNPDLDHGPLMITEGEIKSIVTFQELDNPDIQVVGLPGKSTSFAIPERFEPVYILLDPDAYVPDPNGTIAVDRLAEQVGKERARILWLADKVDDMIVDGDLNKHDLIRMMKSGRRVR